MHKRILTLLIFILFSIAYADSAVQTDWTEGSGVLGPVTDWGSFFILTTALNGAVSQEMYCSSSVLRSIRSMGISMAPAPYTRRI